MVGLEGGGFFSFPSDTYLHDIEVVEGVNTGSGEVVYPRTISPEPIIRDLTPSHHGNRIHHCLAHQSE